MATPGETRAGDNRAAGHPARYPVRQPSRWLRNLILLALVAAGALLAFAWPGLREQALVGSAYAARIGCECRYVSQRSLASCEGDLGLSRFGRVAGLVSLSEDSATKTISGGVPLLGRQSATFDPRSGCQPEAWRD